MMDDISNGEVRIVDSYQRQIDGRSGRRLEIDTDDDRCRSRVGNLLAILGKRAETDLVAGRIMETSDPQNRQVCGSLQ